MDEWKSQEEVKGREVKSVVSESVNHCSTPGKPVKCSHFNTWSTPGRMGTWLTSKPQYFEVVNNKVHMLEGGVQNQLVQLMSLWKNL